MTFYHMIVATIGTRILQRLPFERLRPKPINMDVSVNSQPRGSGGSINARWAMLELPL